jgi:hypothetical protein
LGRGWAVEVRARRGRFYVVAGGWPQRQSQRLAQVRRAKGRRCRADFFPGLTSWARNACRASGAWWEEGRGGASWGGAGLQWCGRRARECAGPTLYGGRTNDRPRLAQVRRARGRRCARRLFLVNPRPTTSKAKAAETATATATATGSVVVARSCLSVLSGV